VKQGTYRIFVHSLTGFQPETAMMLDIWRILLPTATD